MRGYLTRVTLAAGLLIGHTAFAQNTEDAAAQGLFDDAKKLVREGKLAEACPKFLASFKLDPKPGALINLADCYENNGQTASAWARFREAASMAERANQSDRVEYARAHAKALESKLSRLTVVVRRAAPGTEVLRDGIDIDGAAWGTPVPVDPGKHVIEAKAPGKRPWSATVDVLPNGTRTEIEVPPLDNSDKGAESTPLSRSHGAPNDRPAGDRSSSPQRAVGLLVGGGGLVGIGLGAAFGAIAASKWSTVRNDHCGGTSKCDAEGVELAHDAKVAATISTVSFVLGGAALVGGGLLVVTAPARRKRSSAHALLRVQDGGAVVAAEGVFR